jgi:hypothetical protein
MITSDLVAGDVVYGIFSPFYYRVYIVRSAVMSARIFHA